MSNGHGSSQHGAQTLGRRRFLGAAATAAAGTGLAVGTAGTAAAADTFPRVTTRDHYDITWYGSVYLKDGHTEWDYDTAGAIPGIDTAAPDELLVHVHGWKNEPDSAVEGFQTSETAFQNNGYDGDVIGFSWDSDSSVFGWWDSTEIAEENGKKLANFVNNYRQANPGTTIRLVCHSLGARVTLRCIEVLNANGITDAVQSVTLLGGAADNDAVSTGGRYGPDLASAVGQVDNYWKDGDDVLNWAYTTAEFDSAVGEEGCEGTPPANYQDHNVNYVPDHYSYYYPDVGCVSEVVAEW